MSDAVKIIECPRDAWQGLPEQIRPETKAAYLCKLVDAGFTHIDAVSFVSPAAVPQMADSEQVLQLLDPPERVEIIGIVVNRKGAERAIATRAVRTLGFPYSVSPEFLRRNQNQTPQESLHTFKEIATLAGTANLGVVAYLSMAFGNRYGDRWSIDQVATACRILIDSGAKQISLADTVGLATPEQIAETVANVIGANPGIEIGVHLHARHADAGARIRAAFDAGCRRFDAAIGGLGGCPFADDVLVGNIATETLLAVVADCGAQLPAMAPLHDLIRTNAEIANPVRMDVRNARLEDNMKYTTILVADDPPIRTITLNRPHRRNAITPEMQSELISALEDATASECRVLVLNGAGKTFCSGLDLAVLENLAGQSASDHRADAERTAKLFRTLYEFPKPTIAAVEGAAIAGGTGLATVCDFTLATPEAKFGFTETQIGFVPALVSAFLALQIGDKLIRDLLLTGRFFDAAEAYRIGLVNDIVPADRLVARVQALAEQLALNSPQSQRATKALLAAQNKAWLDTAITLAMDASAEARQTEDFHEGVTAFLQKRTPKWPE